jgi:hypothetical protein
LRSKFIFEKFEEESDPVYDMRIGLRAIYDNIKPNDIFKVKKDIISSNNTILFPKNTLILINTIYRQPGKEYDVCLGCDVINKQGYVIEYGYSSWLWSYKFFKEYFEPYHLVKETLDEKFTQESDPIKDLGIGINQKNFFEHRVMKTLSALAPESIDVLESFFNTDIDNIYLLYWESDASGTIHGIINVITIEKILKNSKKIYTKKYVNTYTRSNTNEPVIFTGYKTKIGKIGTFEYNNTAFVGKQYIGDLISIFYLTRKIKY